MSDEIYGWPNCDQATENKAAGYEYERTLLMNFIPEVGEHQTPTFCIQHSTYQKGAWHIWVKPKKAEAQKSI
jgi:hypothetical protein